MVEVVEYGEIPTQIAIAHGPEPLDLQGFLR